MRGTCSVGFILRAEGEADQMLPEPYERIHSQTMVPYAHLFWSAAWLGVAAGAFGARAPSCARRRAMRAAACRPAAAHLTRARVSLETLRGAVQAGLAKFERHAADPGGLTAMDAQLALNFLKVEASELAVDDGDERDARLRPRGLSQRQRVRDGPVSCATSSPRRS